MALTNEEKQIIVKAEITNLLTNLIIYSKSAGLRLIMKEIIRLKNTLIVGENLSIDTIKGRIIFIRKNLRFYLT